MILGIVTLFGVFIGLLACLGMGYRWGRRKAEPESYESTAADGVVFAVLGLLLAFSFNSAYERFDQRRNLITDQANALRVAWEHVDLLPEPDREPIRKCMREWVELILQPSPGDPDSKSPAFNEWISRANWLQRQTWHLAMKSADSQPKPQYAALVLNPIDQWMDFSATRLALNNRGLPVPIFIALIALSLTGAVLAGFNAGRRPHRSLPHMFIFAGVIAVLLFLTVDMTFPRSGLIRADAADNALRRLYANMVADSPAATKP